MYYGLEITQDKRVSYTATNHNFVILRGDSLQAAAIVRYAVGGKHLFTPDAENLWLLYNPSSKMQLKKMIKY